MATSALFIALLCALLLNADAAFTKFEIPGAYKRVHGPTTCPEDMRIGRMARLNMNSSTVNYRCLNGAPEMDIFETVDAAPTNSLTTYLVQQRGEILGQFVVAVVTKDINCTSSSINFFQVEAPVVVNFFRPYKTTMFNFSKIFENATETSSEAPASASSHPPLSFAVRRQGPADSHNSLTPVNRRTESMGHSSEANNPSSETSHSTTPSGSATEGRSTSSGTDAESTTHGGSANSVSAVSNGLIEAGQTLLIDRNMRYMVLGSDCFYRQTIGPACFPGSATVRLASGAVVRMDELRLGDRVQTGRRQFSPVFFWTHRDDTAVEMFIRLTTASGHVLTLSEGHFVYADGVAIPAGDVRVGAKLRLGNGRFSDVVRVTEVAAKGLYNPQTLQGDIVVDGVVASTYTTAVKPGAAHALLAPVRYMYSALRAVFGGIADGMGPATGEL